MMQRWYKTRLTARDVDIIMWVLVFQAAIRGLDYMFGYDNTTQMIEQAFTLTAWGWAFLLGAVVLGLGMMNRWHAWVWFGHGLLWLMHGALFIGFLIPVLVTPWLDGIRSATVLLLTTAVHGLMMLRTGVKPLHSHEAKEVEGISAPEGEA